MLPGDCENEGPAVADSRLAAVWRLWSEGAEGREVGTSLLAGLEDEAGASV